MERLGLGVGARVEFRALGSARSSGRNVPSDDDGVVVLAGEPCVRFWFRRFCSLGKYLALSACFRSAVSGPALRGYSL